MFASHAFHLCAGLIVVASVFVHSEKQEIVEWIENDSTIGNKQLIMDVFFKTVSEAHLVK